MLKSPYIVFAMPQFALLILLLVQPFALPNLVLADEAEEGDGTKVEEAAPEPKEHKAERFVMPMTQWLEGKAHDSRVLNPTSDRINAQSKPGKKGLLRLAIRKALKEYPGTVLSASKETGQEGLDHFKIKILSASGTINEVDISSADLSEPTQE